VEALSLALGTPYEVSGAVHLQQPLAMRLWHEGLRNQRQSVTALRIENFGPSVTYRVERLRAELKAFGETHVIDTETSLAFWDELRQLSVLQGTGAPLWRISTAPQAGPKVVDAVRRYMDCRAYYDWSGGLVWLDVFQPVEPLVGELSQRIKAVFDPAGILNPGRMTAGL
jgi:glycolate oxidase FAD binding subunit